jgi:Cu/Ag efflux protein CusF
MRKLTILALALAAALPLGTYAQKKAEATGMAATAPGQAAAGAAVTAQGVIESVDKATRHVKIKFANGETRTIVAGDEVKNFDQIKVGDKLNIKYVEAVTIELKKGSTAPVARQESKSIERAKPGDKPAAVAKREVTLTAEVMSVDAAAKKVSLKNDKGEIVPVDVQDPEQLKLIKKGDKVEVTYMEALGLSLESPAPAAPAKDAPKKDAPKK